MKKQEGHYTIKRFDFYENLPKQGNANWLYLLEDGSTYIWNQDSKKYKDIAVGKILAEITNTSDLVNDGEDGSDVFLQGADLVGIATESYVDNALSEYSFSQIGTSNEVSLLKDGISVSTIDLTQYLDDTNLARIVSGTVGVDGIAIFIRDDGSPLTVDFSNLIDIQPENTSELINDGSDGINPFLDQSDICGINEFIHNIEEYYAVLAHEGAGGNTKTINVNGNGVTYNQDPAFLINASSDNSGSGIIVFSAGTNQNFNRRATTIETIKDVGEYFEVNTGSTGSFDTQIISISTTPGIQAESAGEGNYRIRLTASGFTVLDPSDAVVATGAQESGIYKVTRTFYGFKFEKDGIELYTSPKSCNYYPNLKLSENEGQSLELDENGDLYFENKIISGSTGIYQLGDTHRVPEVILNTNDTVVVTGHNLTQSTGLKLYLGFEDAAGAHEWQPFVVNVDRLIERSNDGSSIHYSLTIFDNDYIQVFVDDAVTGALRFVDVGREMAYSWSELWVNASNVETLFQVPNVVSIVTTNSFQSIGQADSRILGSNGDIVYIEYGDGNRDSFVFLDNIARQERNGFGSNDIEIQVNNNILEIRDLNSPSGVENAWYKQNINAGIVNNNSETTTTIDLIDDSLEYTDEESNTTSIDLSKYSSLNSTRRIDYTEINSSKSASFIGFIGQSNGDGTELLPTEEQITSLANVFILNRSNTISGSSWVTEDSWIWSNFTSNSAELNLGKTDTGHYKNFTTEFAREWQNRIDNGEDLPDLYLFHMSWSGNGFGLTEENFSRYNPTSPTYADVRANIWTGSIKLHRWALNNLIENNNTIVHLGLNNNQWEHDAKYQIEAENYLGWIQSLLSEHDKIAGVKIPFSYFDPATDGSDGRFIYYEEIRNDLTTIKDRLVTKLDAKELSFYDETIVTTSGYRGVFNDDVHYSSLAFDELENQFWDKEGHKGILLSNIINTNQTSELGLFNFINEVTESKTFIFANEFNIGTVLDFYLMENNTGEGLDQNWHVVREDNKKYFAPVGWEGTYNFWFFEGIPDDTINASIIISNIKTGTPINYHGIFCAVPTASSTFRDSGYNYISIGVSADLGVITNSEDRILIWDISTDTTLQAFQDVTTSDPAYNLLGFGTTTGTTIDTDLRISLLNIGGVNYARIEYREWTQENVNTWTQIGTDIAITLPPYSQNGGKVGLINGLGNINTVPNEDIRFAGFEVINLE